ncbi:MAG: hypothetical protein JKP98_21050 [Rhodobacteraceae bacterium]|nr:hypothetical protein [Paracoccaceae bacterium]
MVEIRDTGSAEAWLEGKPSAVQVAFAARAALRALPMVLRARNKASDHISLSAARATLIAGADVVGGTLILRLLHTWLRWPPMPTPPMPLPLSWPMIPVEASQLLLPMKPQVRLP